MKLHLPKMLFAAVTAALVCVSSAYAATYEVTGADSPGDPDLVNAVAGDTLTMNVNNAFLHQGVGDTAITNVDANIQVSKWNISNGFSGRVYSFNGAITGSGGITFAFTNVDDRGSNKSLLGSGAGNIYRFTGDVSGFSGNISSTLNKFDVEFTDSRSGSNSQSTINKTCVSGTGSISIAGELTYKVNGASTIKNSALGTTGVLTFLNGDSVDSSSSYTIGNGTAKTAVTATNLTIAEDVSVTLAAKSEMVVTNKINNQGSLNIDGKLVINGITKQNATSSFGKSSTGTQGGSKNGYAMLIGGTAVIANKAITVGEGGSIEGVVSTEMVDGIGFVATMQDDYGRVTDRTKFYINEGTVKLGEDGYTDYNASTYYVASNAVMDLNGQGFSDRTISLAEGATLANTDGSWTDNSILMKNLALTGNAKLDIDNNHGLLSRAWGDTNLTLGGYTLTKTGAGTFYLVKTAVTGGGKIATTEGTLQIGSSVDNASAKGKVTTATGVEFSVSEGAALSMENGAQLHAKSVTGEGSISGDADTTLKLTSDTNSSFNGDIAGGFALIKEGTGTQALNGESVLGAITLNGGTLAIGGKTGAASLTMADNTMLEFGKAGQLTLSSSISLSADDIKMADGITFDSTDSLTLIYMEGEGSIITFDDIDQWSSQVYTIGNKDYILELDNSGQSLVAQFKAASIPEPTTATLSLLALCGLCARRRRK